MNQIIHFLQNDNTDSTNKHEERMAFIISWLLELHSTNYDENGNLFAKGNYSRDLMIDIWNIYFFYMNTWDCHLITPPDCLGITNFICL